MKKSQLFNFFRVTLLLLIFSAFTTSAWGATLYLKTGGWQTDNARFSAYFFGSGTTWVSMTKVSDGVYSCEAPSGYPSVIFCRMHGGTTDNNWDNRSEQTGNLTVPTDGKNLYDRSNSSWSTYSGEDTGGDTGGSSVVLPTQKGACQKIVIQSKNDYGLYVFKDANSINGLTWNGSVNNKGTKVGNYYQWVIDGNDYVQIIFRNSEGKKSGDSDILYGGYNYIFDKDYTIDNNGTQKPVPTSFSEVDCDSGDDDDDTGECKTLYLKPNVSDWSKGDERYVAYFFKNGVGHTWVNMEESSCSGIYKVAVPDIDLTNVIFVRMNGGSVINSWDTDIKWDQTEDLTFNGSNNLFTITHKNGNKWKGSWSSSSCTDKAVCYTCNVSGSDDIYSDVKISSSNVKVIFKETFTFTENEMKNLSTDDKDKFRKKYSVSNEKYSASIPSYDAMTKPCSAIKDGGYYAMLVNPKYAGWGGQLNGAVNCTISGHRWFRSTTDKKSDGEFEITEHTGDENGGMLLFNCKDGSSDKCMPDVLYECIVNDICQNTYINFSAYVACANTGYGLGEGQVSKPINAEFRLLNPDDNDKILAVKNIKDVSLEEEWKQISAIFNSLDASRVKIQLINKAESGEGNDILLDDITFSIFTPEASMEALYKGNRYDSEVKCISGEKITLESKVSEDVFTGTPYYLWQKSEDALSWTTITEVSGVGNADYEKLEAPTKTTYYRVVVANDKTEAENGAIHKETICGLYSVTDPIKVIPQNLELTATETEKFCAKGSTTIELSVENPLTTAVNDVKVNVDIPAELTAKNGANTFISPWEISSIGAGATSKITLTLTSSENLTEQSKDYKIESNIASIGSDITYDIATLPTNSTLKASSTITVNQLPTAKFTVSEETICSGTGNPTGLKYKIEGGTGKYTLNITEKIGATENKLTPSVGSEDVSGVEETIFDAVSVSRTQDATYTITQVTDSKGCSSTPTDGSAKVKVEKIEITEQPEAKIVCAGKGAEFSVTTKDADSYQWEECLKNKDTNIDSNWSPILGKTDNTLSLSNLTLDDNGKKYRVKVWKDKGMCNAIYSEPALLTVNDCSDFSISYLNKLGGTSTKLCLDQDTTLLFSVTNYSQEVDEISDVVVRIEGISDLKLLEFEPNDSKYDHTKGEWKIDKISKGPVGEGTTVTLAVKIKGNVTKPSNFYTEAYISEYNGVEYEYEKAVKSNQHKLEIQAISGKPLIVDFPYAACSQEGGEIDLKSQIKDKTDIDTEIGTLTFYKDDKVTPLPPVSKQNTSLKSDTTIYYVTNTETNKCVSEPVEGKVIVYGTPTATLSGTPSICSNSYATLKLEFEGEDKDGALNYDVTLSDGTTEPFTVSEADITVTPDLTGITDYPKEFAYTLTEVKNIYGCSATLKSSAKVTVNSAPSITINADGNLPADICAGQKYQLPSVTVTNNGSSVTSEGWYLGATKISLGEGKYSYSGGTKITLDQGKYYTFSVEDKDKSLVYKAVNYCGETFKEFRPKLDVNDCGSFEFTYKLSPSTVCVGDKVVLTATLTNKSGVDLKDIKLSQSWNKELIASKDANEEAKAIFVTTGNATPGYDENISKLKNLWVINTLEDNESVTLTTTFSAQEGDTFHIYMTESNGVDYKDNEQNPARKTQYLTVETIPVVSLSATEVTLNCTTPTATITASGAYKYEWSYLDQTGVTQKKSGSTLALQQTDPEVSSLVTEYTVYGYSKNANCQSVEAKTVKVTEDFVKPTIEIKSLPAVCLPTTVDIAEALVEANADAIKYYADQNLTQELTDTEVEAANGVNYYVVGYNDNGCETSIIKIPLNINEVSGDVIVDNIYNGVCPTEESNNESNIIKLSDLVTSDKTSLTFFDKDKNKLTEEPEFDSSKKLAAVTYYITNQESEKCESKNPTEVNLEIFEPVKASISATKTTICSETESAVKITVDSGTPDFTIVYNNGVKDITETISGTTLDIKESLTSDRTYKLVSVTDINNCPAKLDDIEPVTIKVNPRPELVSFEIEDTDDIICEGTSTNLKANFKGTPDFTFTLQTTKAVDGVTKTETTDYTINDSEWSMEISEAGQYKITKLSDEYCESETLTDAELTLTVEELPEVILSATDVTLNCTIPTATITATGGAYRYEWQDDKGSALKTGSELSLAQTDITKPEYNTIYTVYGYSEKANCKSVDAKTVKVTEDFVKPVVDIKISETADGTIPERLDCYQQNIKLEADLTNNKETIVEYIWSSGSDNNTTLINNPGAYTLQVKGENGCISDVATETIEQNIVKPEVSIESYITDPVTGNIIPTIELTCANNEITLEGTITNAEQYAEDYPNGEFTYLWSDGSTTSSTVAKTPLATSPMEYTLIVKSPNGCLNEVDKAKVTVTENVSAPVLNIESVYKLCPSDTLSVKALSSLLPKTAGVTYKFYDEAGVEINDFYGASSENPVSTYYVVGISENGCSSEKVSFDVDFAKNVDFTLTTSQTSMLVGGNETLVTIVPNEDSEVADSYTWLSNGNEVSVDGLEYSTNLYLDTKFEVTANNRCDTDTQEAFVEVLWPTAFTPHNGNGKNDTFAKGMHLIVFNRFYTKIFEGNDGWDGTINGAMNDSNAKAVPGVYYYSVQLPNGQVKKGTIEIVKVD